MELTDEEAADLRTAFSALYGFITRMPSYEGDIFDRPTLVAIHRTEAKLKGLTYDPVYYGDDEQDK